MKEYVSMPEGWRTGHADDVDRWVGLAIAHTASLPPKKKKPKR